VLAIALKLFFYGIIRSNDIRSCRPLLASHNVAEWRNRCDLMRDADPQLMRLQDLHRFAASGSLEESLPQQAALTAGLIGAASCSVMLLNRGAGQDLRMSICAHHGPLPAAALSASIGKGEGICGRVLDSGRSLLVEDLGHSELAALARRQGEMGPSLMSSPIRIDGKIVGVVNVCGAQAKVAFDVDDLHLLDVITLFIGKSIQVLQLQNLLDSRFAQLALLEEFKGRVGSSVHTAYQYPDDAARILAKSFFKEMTKAGFGSSQIVNAASELIDQLNGNLQRHSKRAARNEKKQ
jgi:L-methionine (R)-S-oxide reductase